LKGFVIGIGIVVIGLFFANPVIIGAGLLSTVAFTLLNRQPQIFYVEKEMGNIEQQVQHIVMQGPPPAEHVPMPHEVGLPMPEVMSQMMEGGERYPVPAQGIRGGPPEVDPFQEYRGKKMAGAMGDWYKQYGMDTKDFLPFGNYGYTFPGEWMLAGMPINVGKIAFGEHIKAHKRMMEGERLKKYRPASGEDEK
jgi:hypothetical protein